MQKRSGTMSRSQTGSKSATARWVRPRARSHAGRRRARHAARHALLELAGAFVSSSSSAKRLVAMALRASPPPMDAIPGGHDVPEPPGTIAISRRPVGNEGTGARPASLDDVLLNTGLVFNNSNNDHFIGAISTNVVNLCLPPLAEITGQLCSHIVSKLPVRPIVIIIKLRHHPFTPCFLHRRTALGAGHRSRPPLCSLCSLASSVNVPVGICRPIGAALESHECLSV
jgi:hypothetical protein